MSNNRFDIHQHITDRIVAAIEAGTDKWQMPWHRGSGSRRPVNVASGNPYNGVNILALWIEAQVHGYGSHLWGTYRQWAAKGAIVRKGQKASYVIFYRQIEIEVDDTDQNDPKRRLVARAAPVFNADQVDGDRTAEDKPQSAFPSVASVDGFVAATGAIVRSGGRRACFFPHATRSICPNAPCLPVWRRHLQARHTTRRCYMNSFTGRLLPTAAIATCPVALVATPTRWRN
ncbi:antirestriction protein ArdC [Bradyrhizobium sp. USDA 4501]